MFNSGNALNMPSQIDWKRHGGLGTTILSLSDNSRKNRGDEYAQLRYVLNKRSPFVDAL